MPEQAGRRCFRVAVADGGLARGSATAARSAAASARASPAGDAHPALLVEGCDSRDRERARQVDAAGRFFLGPKRNALAEDELVLWCGSTERPAADVHEGPGRATPWRSPSARSMHLGLDRSRGAAARARTLGGGVPAGGRRRSTAARASPSELRTWPARSTTSAAPLPTAATLEGADHAGAGQGAGMKIRRPSTASRARRTFGQARPAHPALRGTLELLDRGACEQGECGSARSSSTANSSALCPCSRRRQTGTR